MKCGGTYWQFNYYFFNLQNYDLEPKTTRKDWLACDRQKSPSKVIWEVSVNVPNPSGLLHTSRGNNSKYLQLKSCLNYCIWLTLKQSNLTLYHFQKTENSEKLKLVFDNSVPSSRLLKAHFLPAKAPCCTTSSVSHRNHHSGKAARWHGASAGSLARGRNTRRHQRWSRLHHKPRTAFISS